MALEFRDRHVDSVLVTAPVGRIDESTADAFKLGFIERVQTNDASVYDLSCVDYMSSRGLRALTLGQRAAIQAGHRFSIASLNETMREIFALSRYDQAFKIEPDIAHAIKALQTDLD